MRRQKQKSIVKYVAHYFLSILIVLALVMLVFVLFLSKRLTYGSIRRELDSGLRQNSHHFHVENGSYVLDDGFIFQDEGWIYVILDENGNLLEGAYPNQFSTGLVVDGEILNKVRVNGTVYYVRDRTNNLPFVLRCVVEKNQLNSDYDKFVYWTWAFALFIIGFSIVVWNLLEKREMRQVNQVVEEVGKIGNQKDLSKRIEYDGGFVEIISLAQANNRMLERIEEMFETQKRFTSDVAHELRTPITVLMAECEYASRQIQNDSEAAEAFQVVERQTKKMNHIVTQMLNLSRLDQEKVKLNMEWIDIGEIVDAVCDDISIQNTKQVTFKIDIAPFFNVYADIGLMTILIQNLIDNAVKYGPEQGTVWIWSEETEEEYLLHIKDEGNGISEENQEKIFRRFFQVEKSESVEGFGLGLSLVKRIAEKHHGTVTVESRLNVGSIFTLYLPKTVK